MSDQKYQQQQQAVSPSRKKHQNKSKKQKNEIVKDKSTSTSTISPESNASYSDNTSILNGTEIANVKEVKNLQSSRKDGLICAFAQRENKLLFCWMEESVEKSCSEQIMRSFDNTHGQYHLAVKNRKILSKLKKHAYKFHRSNVPYDPTLLNITKSPLFRQYLLYSNSWLEFISCLKKPEKKWFKVREEAAKNILDMYTPFWNFIDLDLSLFLNDIHVDIKEFIISMYKRYNRQDSKVFRSRRNYLISSWLFYPDTFEDNLSRSNNSSSDGHGFLIPASLIEKEGKCVKTPQSPSYKTHSALLDVGDNFADKMLPQVLSHLSTILTAIKPMIPDCIEKMNKFHTNHIQNKEKSPKYSISTIRKYSEGVTVDDTKEDLEEKEDADQNIVSKVVYQFDVVDLALIVTLFSSSVQDLYSLHKPLPSNLEPRFCCLATETSWKKKIQEAFSNAFKSSTNHTVDDISAKDKESLIEELKSILVKGNKSNVFAKYHFLHDEALIDNKSLVHEPYEVNSKTWLNKLGCNVSWPEIYLMRANLEKTFSPGVLDAVEKLQSTSEPPILRTSYLQYSSTTFTIDANATKDIDDALTIMYYDQQCIQITIHIADVTSTIIASGNYATSSENENTSYEQHVMSAIDTLKKAVQGNPIFLNARKRATSVYIPGDEVTYSMLPKELSEKQLSLLEGQERKTVSCTFKLFTDGTYQFEGISKGIIKVSKNYSFEDVEKLIEDQNPQHDFWRVLYNCCCGLNDKRLLHGAKTFVPDSDVKVKVKKTENDQYYVSPYVEVPTHDLKSSAIITEVSILLNATMGQFFLDHNICGLFKESSILQNYLFDDNISLMDSDTFIAVSSLVGGSSQGSYIASNTKQKEQNWEALHLHYVEQMDMSKSDISTITRFTTAPKIYQNQMGVPYYLTITAPLRRLIDLTLQIQLTNFMYRNYDYYIYCQKLTFPIPKNLSVSASPSPPNFIYTDLFSEDELHSWASEINETTKVMRKTERQILYHWITRYIQQNFEDCSKSGTEYIIEVVSERYYRRQQQKKTQQQTSQQMYHFSKTPHAFQQIPVFLQPYYDLSLSSSRDSLITYDRQVEFDSTMFQMRRHIQFLPLIYYQYKQTCPLLNNSLNAFKSYNFFNSSTRREGSPSPISFYHLTSNGTNSNSSANISSEPSSPYSSSPQDVSHVAKSPINFDALPIDESPTKQKRLKVRVIQLAYLMVEINFPSSQQKKYIEDRTEIVKLKVNGVDTDSHTIFAQVTL